MWHNHDPKGIQKLSMAPFSTVSGFKTPWFKSSSVMKLLQKTTNCICKSELQLNLMMPPGRLCKPPHRRVLWVTVAPPKLKVTLRCISTLRVNTGGAGGVSFHQLLPQCVFSWAILCASPQTSAVKREQKKSHLPTLKFKQPAVTTSHTVKTEFTGARWELPDESTSKTSEDTKRCSLLRLCGSNNHRDSC